MATVYGTFHLKSIVDLLAQQFVSSLPNELVDKQRACKFRELYDGCNGFGFMIGYFDDEGRNSSVFNRDCKKKS